MCVVDDATQNDTVAEHHVEAPMTTPIDASMTASTPMSDDLASIAKATLALFHSKEP